MTGFAGEHGLSTEVDDLAPLLADWPVQKASVGVTHSDRTLGLADDPEWVTCIASVAKLLVGMVMCALAILIVHILWETDVL